MLDFEHLGTELAEDGGGIGASEEVADIDDPDARKRERSSLTAGVRRRGRVGGRGGLFGRHGTRRRIAG
jgi:hypothetical protein